MKEIIVFGQHMGLGGAERVFSELSDEWVKMGRRVTVIQARPDMGVKNYNLNPNIEIIDLTLPKGSFRRLHQTRELVQILRKKEDAVLLAFMPQTKLLSAMASGFVKNRIVFTERNDPANSPGKQYLRLVRNITYHFADAIVFQTKDAKDYFSKKIQHRGVIIPNPLHPNLPNPYTGEKKHKIVCAARLEAQKNIPMLIEAFSRFHEDYSDYHLEIYGEGSLRDRLNYQIIQSGLGDCARLAGFSHNIYSDIYDSAMYVSSSNFEGISNSMLEAMGLGIPTICTDCPVGGARETIQNKINGILIPVGDTQALYEAMKQIAGNPEFAKTLSENALKIRDKLSVKIIAEKWIEVIDGKE